MPNLFDHIQIGDLKLPNRIFMAPLTRCRAIDRRIPNRTDGRILCPARQCGIDL